MGPLYLLLLLCVNFAQCHVVRQLPVTSVTSGDDNMCNTCVAAMRVASDYLCDFEFVAWAISQIDDTLCAAVAQREDCEQVRYMPCPASGRFYRETLVAPCDIHVPRVPASFLPSAQITEALLPIAIEYARTSVTPAGVCSAAGICGGAASMARDPKVGIGRAVGAIPQLSPVRLAASGQILAICSLSVLQLFGIPRR